MNERRKRRMMEQKERVALKHTYLEKIVDVLGGEIVPQGVAIEDESGEWVVINPIVKKDFDIDSARAAMDERAAKAAEKAEKAAKKAAEKAE